VWVSSARPLVASSRDRGAIARSRLLFVWYPEESETANRYPAPVVKLKKVLPFPAVGDTLSFTSAGKCGILHSVDSTVQLRQTPLIKPPTPPAVQPLPGP